MRTGPEVSPVQREEGEGENDLPAKIGQLTEFLRVNPVYYDRFSVQCPAYKQGQYYIGHLSWPL